MTTRHLALLVLIMWLIIGALQLRLVYGQEPPSVTVKSSDLRVSIFASGCSVNIGLTGKVTISDLCVDMDDAARTFWKAVESSFPCMQEKPQ